jgi:nucleoside-diphosphate-sugar epimerase
VTRVLVTGASGFIGAPLVSALAASGMAVEPAADRRWLLDGADAVVHLAGIAHIGSGVPEATYDQVNHVATAALAQRAAAAGVRRFVFMSSLRAQTGPSADHVLTERDEPRPTDAYGRSKLAAEAAVRAAGVPFTILRPALVHGPNVKGNLASLLRLARLPVPLPFASFTNRRSMVALDNLIAAVRFALESPAALGETFIVADPHPATFAEIVTILRTAMGRRPGLVPLPPALFARALALIGKRELWERLGGNLVADPGKLIAAGWRPVVDTAAGLTAMAQAASPRKSGTASRSTP